MFKDTDDRLAWITCFACVYGWNFHPGFQRDGAQRLTVEEAAAEADLMFREFLRRRSFDEISK